MASGTFAVTVNGAGMSGRISWSSTDDAANNRSYVTATLQVSKASGYSTTYGTFSGAIVIAGVSQSYSGSFSIAAGVSNKTVFSKSQWVGHNINGVGSATISVSGGISGTSWTTTSGSSTVSLADYDRRPYGASTSVGARYNDGQTVNLSFGAYSPTGSIDAYQFMWRYAWSGWQQTIDSGSSYAFGTDAGQTYYFVSRAHNSDGWSDWSGEAGSGGYGVAGTPSAPSLSSSNNGSTVNITTYQGDGSGLSILENQWAWSYDNANWNYFSGVGSTSFSRTNTGNVYVTSRSRNRVGWGPWSATSYLAGVPSTPYNIVVSKVTIGGYGLNNTISWTAPSNNGAAITNYEIRWSTNNSTWISLGTTTALNTSHNSLSAGATYYYQIRAYNQIGWGAYSVSGSRYIPQIPTTPTITSFTRVTGDIRKLSISWNASNFDGAVAYGYKVKYKVSNDNITWPTQYSDLTQNFLSTTAFTSSDLPIVKYYKFAISAESDTGISQTETSESIFLSAYGYRYAGGNFNTAISNAYRYKSGQWIAINNVEKYINSQWKALEQ